MLNVGGHKEALKGKNSFVIELTEGEDLKVHT